MNPEPGSIEAPASAAGASTPPTPAPSIDPALAGTIDAASMPATPAPGAPPPRVRPPGWTPAPRKLVLPLHAQRAFFGSPEGVRIVIYGVLLALAVLGVMVSAMRARLRDPAPASPFPVVSVVPAAPIAAVSSAGGRVEEGVVILEGVTDFAPLEPDVAYATLSDWVQRLDDDERALRLDPSIGFEDLLARPAARRGALVRTSGLLIHTTPIRFDPSIASTTSADVWRSLLVDPSGFECWVVDSALPPPPVKLRHDLVEVEGAFLKVLRYPNQHGHTRDAPFLVARSLRAITEGEVERPVRVDVGIAGAAAGILLIMIAFAAGRRAPSVVETFKRQRRARDRGGAA